MREPIPVDRFKGRKTARIRYNSKVNKSFICH